MVTNNNTLHRRSAIHSTLPLFIKVTVDEFNELIDKAEKDSLMNKVKSANDLKKEINTWSTYLFINYFTPAFSLFRQILYQVVRLL